MVVARYQQPMLRPACSMVPNQQVAEEAVQDMWLGVVRGNERLEGRSSLKTWLFRIRVNRARSAGSREPTDPSIETIHAVDATRLDAQGQWADPVTFRDVEGLSSSEASAVLGISEGNQWTLLHRGRARLREILDAAIEKS